MEAKIFCLLSFSETYLMCKQILRPNSDLGIQSENNSFSLPVRRRKNNSDKSERWPRDILLLLIEIYERTTFRIFFRLSHQLALAYPTSFYFI